VTPRRWGLVKRETLKLYFRGLLSIHRLRMFSIAHGLDVMRDGLKRLRHPVSAIDKLSVTSIFLTNNDRA
jgi:hypothetical protein